VIHENIDYRRLAELYEEFDELWTRLHAFYLDAVAGFRFVASYIQAEQSKARYFVQDSDMDSEAAQDERIFSYDEIFSDGFCASGIHQATQGEAKTRNMEGGSNFTTLGRVCLVSFYDFWEDYLRREYVVAKGHLDPNERGKEIVDKCVAEHARHDLWGDIGKLRQGIVHNRGVAGSEVKKCTLIKWFQPGDEIVLGPDRMRAIFMALLNYRNELHKEQFYSPPFIIGS
jgi:hypothetical protein